MNNENKKHNINSKVEISTYIKNELKKYAKEEGYTLKDYIHKILLDFTNKKKNIKYE